MGMDIQEKSLQEGLQEGLKKGEIKGEAKLFLKLLVAKFGEIPDWVNSKIAKVDAKTIEQWAAKLLVANTLEEVFE